MNKVDAIKLQEFHKTHFPSRAIPQFLSSGHQAQIQQEEDDLGYYEDGVKRTLTDEQIAMFRYSEVQRLLQARRRQKEKDEDEQLRRESKEQFLKPKLAGVNKEPVHKADRAHERSMPNALMYEEDSLAKAGTDAQPQTFLWPRLGSES